MSISRQSVATMAPQRRGRRSFMAYTVAPKCARPAALRELYKDAGSIIRDAAPEITTSRPE
ncbi:hypothetical protein [Actinokineospora bangkokensis]|uniref:Uncharacterized protein n=1 Tax=Actinokineospora bangkokensis TaxID=1193682 RepID=A0A1Q9LF02_9PSEU|nr:hypothetical protein [Actinokineospora bangkokensis]OLR90617.1 hypothetical protein BJP25_28815 [Actinokineospora bangkokensis]